MCFPSELLKSYIFLLFTLRIKLKRIFQNKVSFLKSRSTTSLIPIRIIGLLPHLHTVFPSSRQSSACLRTFSYDIRQISWLVQTISSEKIRINSDVFEILSEKIRINSDVFEILSEKIRISSLLLS